MPLTGKYSWKSCRGTEWGLRPASSFVHTSADFVWCILQGGYYGAAFQVFLGVNQVEPLSPTIFNVVVDAVVRHWISLVEGSTGGQYGWGR